MKLFQTIRARLFLCYTSIIAAVIILFSVIYAHYTSSILQERASESLQQLAITLNNNLDSVFQNMNDTANRIISSDLIKETFYEQPATESERLQNKQRMMNLLFTSTGSSMGYPINLFQTNGHFIQYGRKFDIWTQDPESIASASWVLDCLSKEGRMHLTYPRHYEWYDSDTQVISVCRAFNQTFGAPYDAITEVVLPYDQFAEIITSVLAPYGQESAILAYVFDEKGRQVYPLLQEGEPSAFTLEEIRAQKTRDNLFHYEIEKEPVLAAYSVSSFTGLTIIMAEKEHALLAPVTDFQKRILYISCFCLVLTMLVTFVISRQLAEPIRKIQHSINHLDLADLSAEESELPKNSAYELTKLHRAYLRMAQRLQLSLRETLTARSRETEARMLALQAQMNPHFLYNTITIISIKAEDNEDPEVVALCEALTAMLRYIAQDSPRGVTMEHEIEHLNQYLFLMETRFPGKLHYSLRLEDGMEDLTIPKLTIQPLVENSFKHGFKQTPPWDLSIRGWTKDDRWFISIEDNGIGFKEETIQYFMKDFYNPEIVVQTEPTDNIGIHNILHRLKIYYKANACFEIINLPDGGCRITIGGMKEMPRLS